MTTADNITFDPHIYRHQRHTKSYKIPVNQNVNRHTLLTHVLRRAPTHKKRLFLSFSQGVKVSVVDTEIRLKMRLHGNDSEPDLSVVF